MNLQPRIETLSEKTLVGKHLSMNMLDNRTAELWRSFMPLCAGIPNKVNTDLISMQVYDASYSFVHFNPSATFTKWAAVEVASIDNTPDGMETFTLPNGLYAVFVYKGNPIQAAPFFQYIFGVWLPSSNYVLDNRPHFEVLSDKYKNNDDSSEEEVWVPIRQK